MKILFVCENYIPHYGGAEVVFKNLAERYVQDGHAVSLLTHQMKGTRTRELMNGVQVTRVPSFHSRYVFTFSAIFRAIRLARKCDIIQTTTFNGAVPAWIAGLVTGKPVVLTVHEIWVGKWQKVTGFSWFKSLVHEILERMIYLLPFDKYVCVSDATRKDLVKRIPSRKAVTIHNGMDYELWDRTNVSEKEIHEVREKLDVSKKFLCFGFGRPGPTKGFIYLIRAVPEIIRHVKEFHLVLMLGSVEKYQHEFSKIKALIRKLGIQDRVTITPSCPYDELRTHIAAADCVVVPSTAEGFGYTTVETNTMGTPLVASDAGSIPEVVSGKFLLFRSRNWRDLAEKVRLVAEGKYEKKKLKRFEWKESVGKYLTLYKSLLRKH